MFSRFQHLERWRFQPYADREDPFKRTYLTRDKLIWRWYCSRIEPPQFCSFWGGGKKGPFEGPQIKWNKENVCVSVGCLSKQELGGVLCWPLRARTSQSPSAKQQQTRQLTVGHKRLLLALLRGLPWKLTDSPPPPLFLSLLMYHPRGQDYEAPEKLASGRKSRSGYHLADTICLECGNALLYVNRHVCDVRYNNGQTGRVFLPTAPSITTWEQVLNCWHGDTSHCVIDIVHANRPRLTRPRFALMTFHDALCQHRASRRHV